LASLAVAQTIRHRLFHALWLRWRAARARPTAPQVAPAPGEDPPFVAPRADAARVAGRRDVVGGAVVDAHTGEPLPGAQVDRYEGVGAAGPRLTIGVGVGGFELGPLRPGRCPVAVPALAFAPRVLECAAPHDGRLDRATWSLVAVRRRVRDAYARAV